MITKNVFAETVESYKLLIPGETFRNDNQKKMRSTIIWLRVYHMSNGDKKNAIKKHLLFSKIQNYAHMILICVLRDYAVDEIFYFARYKKLLNKISDVCAKGYPLWIGQIKKLLKEI